MLNSVNIGLRCMMKNEDGVSQPGWVPEAFLSKTIKNRAPLSVIRSGCKRADNTELIYCYICPEQNGISNNQLQHENGDQGCTELILQNVTYNIKDHSHAMRHTLYMVLASYCYSLIAWCSQYHTSHLYFPDYYLVFILSWVNLEIQIIVYEVPVGRGTVLRTCVNLLSMSWELVWIYRPRQGFTNITKLKCLPQWSSCLRRIQTTLRIYCILRTYANLLSMLCKTLLT